jgi:hypothetical protein
MAYTKLLFNLVLVALLLNCTMADNPVLCTPSDVIGIWRFYIDAQPIPKSDRNYTRFSCGRGQPTELVTFFPEDDNPQADLLSELQGTPGVTPDVRQITVELTGIDDDCYLVDNDDNSQRLQQGNWTMVIHEGFMGWLYDESIQRYITFDSFWRYNQINSDEYESDCTETMLGWYHTYEDSEDDEQWGCFWAEKVSGPYEPASVHFSGGQPQLSTESYDKNE